MRALRSSAALLACSVVIQFAGPAPGLQRQLPAVPDFALQDVNTTSLREDDLVSPRDYLLQVSAFYFASATCSYCRAQFGHLDSLQEELRSEPTGFNIEVLGVNEAGANNPFSNALTTSGRDLPWLQDTTDARVWDFWEVEWRDVRILDPQNRLYAVMNLTANDLGLPHNRQALKDLLLEAATAMDSDADNLPDAWEQSRLLSLSTGATDDPDLDGFDNITEFAFGTAPLDASSQPALARAFDTTQRLQVTFRRWAGAQFNFVVEASPDLHTWTEDGTEINILGEPSNRFDGTGTSDVTYILSKDKFMAPIRFVRARAFLQD